MLGWHHLIGVENLPYEIADGPEDGQKKALAAFEDILNHTKGECEGHDDHRRSEDGHGNPSKNCLTCLSAIWLSPDPFNISTILACC